MHKKLYILLILLISGVVLVVLWFGIKSTKQSRKVYLGAWEQSFWDSKTQKLIPEKLEFFEREIGRKVAIAHYFRGWAEVDSESTVNDLNLINSKGWTPMLSINPYFSPKCSPTKESLYKAIASGVCDKLLVDIAQNFKKFGKPIFLRFAWEMNIQDHSWSIKELEKPEDFILAWRHFHDVMASVGAKNVIWVFSVNTETKDSIPYIQLYPGDSYVDWTALDGYNWGNSQTWSSWTSFDSVFRASYENLLKVSPDKPVMISEFNSSTGGGDKSAWMDDMLSVQIPNNYPKVSAIIFFDEDKTHLENINWNLMNSPQALEVIRKALKNPLYNSSFSFTQKIL